ncbi:hypothetical protein AWN90_06865 [Nocardia terpenica]|uniref:Uncharacterized protein n=2 Tax=Nocardia terpenica TaxID=455432 RepID=A0A164JC57_9NOCA|nr:hypothetical protein AWN90_06865 [Nocardia terpenica]
MVARALAENPGTEYGPRQVHAIIGHSAGAIGNALASLAAAGDADQTQQRPRRYRANAATATAAAGAPAAVAPRRARPAAAAATPSAAAAGPLPDAAALGYHAAAFGRCAAALGRQHAAAWGRRASAARGPPPARDDRADDWATVGRVHAGPHQQILTGQGRVDIVGGAGPIQVRVQCVARVLAFAGRDHITRAQIPRAGRSDRRVVGCHLDFSDPVAVEDVSLSAGLGWGSG